MLRGTGCGRGPLRVPPVLSPTSTQRSVINRPVNLGIPSRRTSQPRGTVPAGGAQPAAKDADEFR